MSLAFNTFLCWQDNPPNGWAHTVKLLRDYLGAKDMFFFRYTNSVIYKQIHHYISVKEMNHDCALKFDNKGIFLHGETRWNGDYKHKYECMRNVNSILFVRDVFLELPLELLPENIHKLRLCTRRLNWNKLPLSLRTLEIPNRYEKASTLESLKRLPMLTTLKIFIWTDDALSIAPKLPTTLKNLDLYVHGEIKLSQFPRRLKTLCLHGCNSVDFTNMPTKLKKLYIDYDELGVHHDLDLKNIPKSLRNLTIGKLSISL
jgi:hypothetical protein